MVSVPYFDGLMVGELDPLIGSFAAEPEMHDPVRGRIRGARAFGVRRRTERAAAAAQRRGRGRRAHVLERRGFEEVLLHLDGDDGRIALPVAVVADKRSTGGSRSCGSI